MKTRQLALAIYEDLGLASEDPDCPPTHEVLDSIQGETSATYSLVRQLALELGIPEPGSLGYAARSLSQVVSGKKEPQGVLAEVAGKLRDIRQYQGFSRDALLDAIEKLKEALQETIMVEILAHPSSTAALPKEQALEDLAFLVQALGPEGPFYDGLKTLNPDSGPDLYELVSSYEPILTYIQQQLAELKHGLPNDLGHLRSRISNQLQEFTQARKQLEAYGPELQGMNSSLAKVRAMLSEVLETPLEEDEMYQAFLAIQSGQAEIIRKLDSRPEFQRQRVASFEEQAPSEALENIQAMLMNVQTNQQAIAARLQEHQKQFASASLADASRVEQGQQSIQAQLAELRGLMAMYHEKAEQRIQPLYGQLSEHGALMSQTHAQTQSLTFHVKQLGTEVAGIQALLTPQDIPEGELQELEQYPSLATEEQVKALDSQLARIQKRLDTLNIYGGPLPINALALPRSSRKTYLLDFVNWAREGFISSGAEPPSSEELVEEFLRGQD